MTLLAFLAEIRLGGGKVEIKPTKSSLVAHIVSQQVARTDRTQLRIPANEPLTLRAFPNTWSTN